MDPVLRRLADENTIRGLVIRFSLAMDARDVGLFRSVWADEIDLDLRTLAGSAIPLNGRRRADDYARDVIALLSGFTATQHLSTNHVVVVTGDDATCDCYTTAQHLLVTQNVTSSDGRRGVGDPTSGGGRAGGVPARDMNTDLWLAAGARYHLTARRWGEDEWRFTAFQLDPIWTKGDRSVWAEAARRMAPGDAANP